MSDILHGMGFITTASKVFIMIMSRQSLTAQVRVLGGGHGAVGALRAPEPELDQLLLGADRLIHAWSSGGWRVRICTSSVCVGSRLRGCVEQDRTVRTTSVPGGGARRWLR